MFGKHLFFFVFPKLGISYKVKKAPNLHHRKLSDFPQFILSSFWVSSPAIPGTFLPPYSVTQFYHPKQLPAA